MHTDLPHRVCRFATALGIAASVLLAGCRTGSPIAEEAVSTFATAEEGLAALRGDWMLVELEGKRLLDWLPPNWEDQPPHLTFETDGRVGGYTGVNRMGSTIDGEALARGEFVLAPVISTRRAGPPELMHLEARFLMALQRARGLRLLGDSLALTPGPKDSSTIARFSRTASAQARDAGAPVARAERP